MKKGILLEVDLLSEKPTSLELSHKSNSVTENTKVHWVITFIRQSSCVSPNLVVMENSVTIMMLKQF